MKHKIILFAVNRGAEVDWILPVLNKLSKKYLIYTYFRSQRSFNSLKSNKQLYKLWKTINHQFYIEKKIDNFLWKLIRKPINTLPCYLKSFFNINLINNKIHNIANIEKKVAQDSNILNPKVIMLFSETGIYSGWVEVYKNKINKPLIIHFPPNPNIYLKKIKKKFILSGDLCLIGSKKSVPALSSLINLKKIKVCGVPKFDNWWIKKITSEKTDFNTKSIKNNKIITVAFNSYFEVLEKNEFVKLEDQLHKLMQVLCSLQNVKIIFKIHPMLNSPHFLKILNMYDKNKWLVSRTHLIKLSNISDCLICNARSGAALDGLSVQTPTFHLWPTRSIEIVDNTLNQLKIVRVVKNELELKKYVKLAIQSPKNSEWIKQKRLFLKNFKFKKSATSEYIKIINKKLKQNRF